MSNPLFTAEQTIEDWTIVFADNNIESVYYQGMVSCVADMPHQIYEQIHFND